MKIYASDNSGLDEFIGTDLWVRVHCLDDFANWDSYIKILCVDEDGRARCCKLYDRYLHDPYYYDKVDYELEMHDCMWIRLSNIKILQPLEVITDDEIYDIVRFPY